MPSKRNGVEINKFFLSHNVDVLKVLHGIGGPCPVEMLEVASCVKRDYPEYYADLTVLDNLTLYAVGDLGVLELDCLISTAERDDLDHQMASHQIEW